MIRLRTLGPLELLGSEGQELRSILAQPKRIALLVYLALAAPRGPHRRDTLIGIFWPEHDGEHARNSLNQSVHVLRRSLGSDMLMSRNADMLSLDLERLWCDAIAFEHELDAGRPADALELYRGDLLEGFHVTDAPEFENWLDTERARLAGRHAKALETIARQREALGDYEGAVTWWRRLSSRDPYSSRVALQLMRALASAGDPAAAVRHGRVHETLLRAELDTPPDSAVAALSKQLQSAVTPKEAQPAFHSVEAFPMMVEGAEPAALEAGQPGAAMPGRVAGRKSWSVRVAGTMVAVLAIAGGAIAVTNDAREAGLPVIRSLAVLPLRDLSADSAQQWLTDGIHDLLITELARYPELRVISRASVLQYQGTKTPLPEIARQLKVDGIVDGAVVKEGGRVRITAQLMHGPSDRHLWAQHYERDLRDVLLLQGELAQAIAREVKVAVEPPERPGLAASGPADSAPQELYLRELYLRGRHAELSRSLIGVQTAREAYRRAIERDSTFALGYAGLAAVYGLMAEYDYGPAGPSLDSARIVALRAVSLDSTLPDTRAALAVALGDAGEFADAEREFRRAIELSPSYARAHYGYSILLVALGRGEEALREAQRASELDPFAPRGLLAMQRYAVYLMTGKRPHLQQLPVSQRRPILKLEPGEPWARAREGVEFAEEGKCAEARSEISRARQLVPADNLEMRQFVGAVHWWCGERPRARAILAGMKRRPDVRDHGYHIAWLHTRFGEFDSAFVWLEHQRWTTAKLSALSASRWMDPLRSDPRFSDLLVRLGLREHHQN